MDEESDETSESWFASQVTEDEDEDEDGETEDDEPSVQ